MILEETKRSTAPVSVSEPHFEVFDEFKSASYEQRYEIFCERLLRERMYDGACLILTGQTGGLRGKYREPNKELAFERFATSLSAHATAFAKMREKKRG